MIEGEGDIMPFAPHFQFVEKPKTPKEPVPSPDDGKFPKKLKDDVNEAYGNAVVNAFKEVCHDAVCGCPICRNHAKKLQEYYELPALPDRWEARKFILVFDKKIHEGKSTA